MKRVFQTIRQALAACAAIGSMLLCNPVLAQDTAAAVGAATGGAAPGGIFLRTRAPSLPPVKNLHYDAAAKAIATDDWVYPLPVSPSEANEIFALVAKQDFLAADVSTRGDAALFGLSRDGKIANRMLIADLLLGDIAKGYGYFAPIYRTAQDYKPKQYNPNGRQQFAVFFVFASEAWRVEGKTLVSKPSKLEAIGVPTIRQSDGTRRFDFESLKRNVQDDAIAENSKHITTNEAYYRRERAVRDMQSFSDVAQLARELRQQSVDIAGLLGK